MLCMDVDIWLMTPILNPLTDAKHAYNKKDSYTGLQTVHKFQVGQLQGSNHLWKFGLPIEDVANDSHPQLSHKCWTCLQEKD